ncbi:MAG: type II toxin-antitoxin system HicA family toxin [Anaerolineae bacterium]|nr:type II toxin-antitoxin system HicA family toxin [Anaerolineae bacterium]
MSKLSNISSRQVIRALEKLGFYVDHQTGSHIIMRRDDPRTTIPIPERSEMRKGTLRKIIKQAGLTVDEFLTLL